MVKSIRGRLQLWYALVLIAVVSGFAGITYYRARETAFNEIDSQLESSTLYIDLALRNVLVPNFDAEPSKKAGKKGPPPKRTREDMLALLDLPPEMKRSAVKPYLAIWRADGSLLKGIDLPEDRPVPELVTPEDVIRPRLYRRPGSHEVMLRGPDRTLILVGRSTVREEEELNAFAWQLAVAGLTVLAIGLAGGWWISSRIFRPIAAMSGAAAAISATNLSGRIDTAQVDRELADLARVLNAAFDRLQEAFERQVRFTADASHELRTPLAIIQSHAQLSLDRPRSADDYRQTIESCLRAANRMKAIVEGLLDLARADAGQKMPHEPVDLGKLVADAIALFRPLSEAKNISLTAELADANVMGDPSALMQVVMNLLQNAIQYNRENGSIHVRLAVVEEKVKLTVADTGLGIPEADRPHIFERFYRVDKARSRTSGGTGLGLAICKMIVEAHGGEIGFEANVGEGTTFGMVLEIESPARSIS